MDVRMYTFTCSECVQSLCCYNAHLTHTHTHTHTHTPHTQVTAVLDGNVTRVMCRLRAVGGNSSKAAVEAHLWSASRRSAQQVGVLVYTCTNTLSAGHLPRPLWTLPDLGILTR